MFKNILLSEKIKKIFFLLSFLIMLGGVIFPQIILEQKRHITHGTDDHLAYVVKAANIKDCIDYKKNECAGLRSIHDQSINSLETVGNKPYYATRQTHRLLFSYHPAYSYSLIFISKFFDISLEKSQFIFEMIIGPSSALAVAFFLYTFFGIIVASIIMPFLAFHLIGSGWGIHHYAPYIVAIQPILIAMALVTKKKFTYNFFALLLMILSSAFHPSGIIMSGAIVLFSFIINDKRFTPKQIFFYLSSFVVFIFYFYQIKFLPVDLSISEFYRENDLLQIIKFNIKTFLGLVKNDSKILFNLGLCLPFFLLGAYRILKNKFRIDLLLPLLITIIFVFLLATFFPSPSTSLFKRTWIITSLFLLGIIGYGIKELFGDFVIHVESKRIKSFEHLLQNLKSNSSYVAVIALALIFLLSSINNLRQTYMHYLDLHIWDSNIYLEKTSIKELSTKIKKDQKILFHFPHIELSEPIIYHFLANGGNKIANIWPIINSTYKKQINKNVRYMLSLSPMNSIDSYGIQQTYFYRKKNIPITGDIFIVERDNLIFKFKSKPKQFKIYLENVGKTASLTTNITHSKVFIPSLFKGWITIELDQYPEDNIIKIYAENVKKPMRIQGFKLNNNQNTFYPWNQGFEFEKNNIKVDFEFKKIQPVENCIIDKVINDYGTSILTSLNCKKND